MPMSANEIKALLRETFPTAEITVQGDDGVHMSAHVVAKEFYGKKPRRTTTDGLCGSQG